MSKVKTGRTQEEKILERVKALMALAQNNSNEHEAAAAAAKAQQLLLEYNLSEDSVKGVGEADEINVEQRTHIEKDYSGWRASLIGSVVRATGCRVVLSRDATGAKAKKYTLFGRESNLDVAVYLYEYLTKELVRISPKPQGTRESHAFRMGACVTIHNRLQETFREFQAQHPTSTALMVVADRAVDDAVKLAFPKLGKAKGGRIGDAGAYQRGKAAGNVIPLNRGVGSTGRKVAALA